MFLGRYPGSEEICVGVKQLLSLAEGFRDDQQMDLCEEVLGRERSRIQCGREFLPERLGCLALQHGVAVEEERAHCC